MCLICVCMARPSVCVDSPSGLIRRQALLQPPHPRVQLAGPRCPVMFAHIVYGGAKRGPILPLDTRRNLVFTRAHFALAEFPNRAPVREGAGAKSLSNYPLQGRDPDLPEVAYGYLNNPLLQEALSFIPLATCFDYAARPEAYDAEKSWQRIIRERFGARALSHWRAIREFCEREVRAGKNKVAPRVERRDRLTLRAAVEYVRRHRRTSWARELEPWMRQLQKNLTADKP